MRIFRRKAVEAVPRARVGSGSYRAVKTGRGFSDPCPATVALCLMTLLCNVAQRSPAQIAAAAESPPLNARSLASPPARVPLTAQDLPPRVMAARRFLARRGWAPGKSYRRASQNDAGPAQPIRTAIAPRPRTQSSPTFTWQALGPDAVTSPDFGLVTGRVSALALDPADPSGNHLYIGTTGGGVWVAQNAAVTNAADVVFTPLTDAVGALSTAFDPSISIGAVTVQPGGTGVVLAGTGDPNDSLDSYYGAGILRSADGGNTWSLTQITTDGQYSFIGEGIAGFAWSSVNPELVVAAVSQAYEGTLVNAVLPGRSFEGLYYSSDGGATWSLATITDGGNTPVQGPGYVPGTLDGNAATSVVWNPIRNLFIAAVRFHGYYQSSDGITFTRMTAQPGSGLTTSLCPTNFGNIGSLACPIFRGTLAVNPLTGDTFAWTVDFSNQDQGLWQDQCALSSGVCGSQNVAFAKQWNTQALETNTDLGAATIANGDYNLTLAAVPFSLQQGADTWLLAGANDLWKCSLAQGCVWRNTTNATTCMSAQVGEFQHALTWSAANPLEILIGNDSGLWRSLDAIGETGPVCSGSDATHFQNLNGGLGSLAEVESLATSPAAQYNMMAGLGVNGTAGLKSAAAPAADWPQILGGYGGPVAIDPRNTANWYVNNQSGVSIYICSNPSTCNSTDFGSTPVITDADVGGDGYVMATPAPFLVDPLDPTQLLIGTCRVWRGPASGVGWTESNAISPVLDSGALNTACSGDGLIRSMAAMPVAGGNEVVYVGMYGVLNGGGGLPGHVLTATINPQSNATPTWYDLSLNPVTNSPNSLNYYDLDISSIFIDSHDPTGKTVYVTVEGFPDYAEQVQTVYGSSDGGVHWASLTANLPELPVNGVVVDPQSASTVYLATDAGVYFTTAVSSCANLPSTCWAAFGTGLPTAPVIALTASPVTASAQVLTAATYGRGIWQTPLWTTATTTVTTATANPASLTFPSQVFGTASTAQTVTLMNTGTLPLMPTGIVMAGDFTETDNCQDATVAASASCSIQVTFTPTATGARTGQMTISVNVYGGQVTVALSGTGAPAGVVTLTPAAISFDPSPTQASSAPPVLLGTTSGLFPVAVGNSSGSPTPITSISITPPFSIASNSCGTASLAAQTDCQIQLAFTPTQEGAVAGTLTIVDGAGTQTVLLSGFGYSPPTDHLIPTSLVFPPTAVGGQPAAAMPVLLTNLGDTPLTCIVAWTGVVTGNPSNCLPEASSGEFTVSSNTCNGQLAGHQGCNIGVIFSPTALGTRTGTLTVYDALRTQTVALSGIGVANAFLTVSSMSLKFPTGSLGVASAPMALTINNTGGVAAANVAFGITGSEAASFATGATTCGASLASGASCTVQVIFTPGTAGGNGATLTVASATAGVNKPTVLLNGVGQVTAGLNVNPAQLTFAATIVGTSSAAQTVTVSNTSAVAASALVFSTSAGFVLAQNACTATLAANASCTVGVVFTPASAGVATGALDVSSSTIVNSAAVELGGTGAAAVGIQLTPATLKFATTGVGQDSSPATVMVTNSGTVSTLANLVITAPAGFELVNNTCPGSLGPGVSCNVGVEFAPTAAGTQTGNLTVTSSSLGTGASVPLSGMGFDFTVTLSGAGTETVSAGQTAGYTLVLTPLAGSAGVFAFACDSLPTNALCLFNPATETLTTGATGNVAVGISTGSTTASLRPKDTGLLAAIPLACGLIVLPLGWKWRHKMLCIWVLIAVLGGLMSGMASCTSSGGGGGGGSGGGNGGGGQTPAGTYSVPLTVTSTGVSHSVTVTLVVD